MQNHIQNYLPWFKKISRLSYPIVIGQLGIILMGVSDIMMIGRIDALNLASASFANSIFFLVSIIGIGTLSAVAPLIAKARGEGHPNQCAILYRQSYRAAVILSVVISLVIFLLTENLDWFGQPTAVTNLTKNYLHILNVGVLPMLLFLSMKQFSDGLELTKPAAVITLLALGLNIFLNWVFIYGKLGMPQWGLFGTGVATTISRGFMAIAMILYINYSGHYKSFSHLKQHENDRHYLKEIFKIGLPSGFQYFFELAAFSFSLIMIGWINEFAMAAHQIAISIASVTYMVATGISAGGAIAVGESYGKRNRTDIIRAGKSAILLGAIFMGLCGLAFALFPEIIVGLYSSDPLVVPMAINLLFIAALFQLSDGIQAVGLGILRGISDTKVPTLITIVAYWVIGIPIGYTLGFKAGMSLYGIWTGLLTGLTFSALFLTYRFIKLSKSKDLSYHPHKTENP